MTSHAPRSAMYNFTLMHSYKEYVEGHNKHAPPPQNMHLANDCLAFTEVCKLDMQSLEFAKSSMHSLCINCSHTLSLAISQALSSHQMSTIASICTCLVIILSRSTIACPLSRNMLSGILLSINMTILSLHPPLRAYTFYSELAHCQHEPFCTMPRFYLLHQRITKYLQT